LDSLLSLPNVGNVTRRFNRGTIMGKRPDHVKPPAYLSNPLGNDPTRYGDWELKGIAIDF